MKGFDLLKQLITRDDLPAEFRQEADAIFNRTDDKAILAWLIRQAEQSDLPAYGEAAEPEMYKIMEQFWIWYAYKAIGATVDADARLTRALDKLKTTSSDAALCAGGALAGWLCQFKQDHSSLRATRLARLAAETSRHNSSFTKAYFAAIAYLIGEKELASQWRQAARQGHRTPDGFDMMYYAISRQFDLATPALKRMPLIPDYTSVVAIAAAAAGREEDYILANRHAEERIPGRERIRRENMDGVRTNLVAAAAMIGNFDLAERRAANLPANWRGQAACYLVREYALKARLSEAMSHWPNTTQSPPGLEAAFYLWRLRARKGESLADLYRAAVTIKTESTKHAALCGIVAGMLEADLPTRHRRDVTFY